MPVNGAAATPLPLEPASESAIGEAAASAATVLCQAMLDFQHQGRLDPATRDAGGSRIAALYELQQGTPAGIDFPATVRREGKRVLRQQLDADFRRQHGADMGEAAMDEIIGWLLEIVAKVTAFERARAN